MLDLRKTDERNDKIERLLQQKAKVESDLARARKAERDAHRRDQTKRKIVLGSVLLAGIQDGRIPLTVGRAVMALLTERDRKLFDSYEFQARDRRLELRSDEQ